MACGRNGSSSLVLVFLLVTLETRRFFETDLIGWRNPASEAENYAYSAVWLALGIVLLAFGLWRASREVCALLRGSSSSRPF